MLLPGFSTAAQVSDVSGRGVGMDVVKTNIQKLNGAIDIRSTPGKGTTFTISLPLTLAILPVLLVRLGEQPFAVPLSMVREILPVQPDEIQEIGGRATMVGIPSVQVKAGISPAGMVFQEKTLASSFYGSIQPDIDFPILADLYMDKKLDLDSLISRTYTLDEIKQGFEQLRKGGVARVTEGGVMTKGSVAS